jgi:hypothetical protein
MDIFVKLLFASCLLLLLAVTVASLGVVGLAVRWVFQVWRGGGSHRPFDQDPTWPVGPSMWRQGAREEDLQDGLGFPDRPDSNNFIEPDDKTGKQGDTDETSGSVAQEQL